MRDTTPASIPAQDSAEKIRRALNYASKFLQPRDRFELPSHTRPELIRPWDEQATTEHHVRIRVRDDSGTDHFLSFRRKQLALMTAVLADMTGKLTVADIARIHHRTEGVVSAVIRELHSAGIVRLHGVDIEQDEPAPTGPFHRWVTVMVAFLGRRSEIPGVDAPAHWLYHAVFRHLYSRTGLLVLTGLTLAGALTFAFEAVTGYEVNLEISDILAVSGGVILSALAHEVMHAMALLHVRPHARVRVGVAWQWGFSPALFVVTTETWLVPSRWARISVALAGAAAHLILAGGAVLAGLVVGLFTDTHPAAPFAFAVSQYVFAAWTLEPLSSSASDGYHTLVDFLDEPGLRGKSLACVCSAVLRRRTSRTNDPRQARIFAMYGLLALLTTLLVIVWVVVALKSLFESFLAVVTPQPVANVLGGGTAWTLAMAIIVSTWMELRPYLVRDRGSCQTAATD
jgi:putative peptide zinc metalloprotease protein